MTPRLLLDEERLDRNIASAAERFRSLGLAFRPHFKTHKSVEIMRRQLAAGAGGITVATLHEAGVAIAGGASDVLVAFPPVGRWRIERLAELARAATITVACTNADQVQALADYAGSRKPFSYYWEIDSGAGRLGTDPGEATADAVAPLADLNGAHLVGLMAFPGHSYRAGDVAGRREVARFEGEALRTTREALSTRGVDAGVLSGGSTPTGWADDGKSELDEYRCGNYVFFDATQVALGVATPEQCALTVEATVLDQPAVDRLILDSGSKALAAERMSDVTPSFGMVAGHPELRIEALYEEHAICRIDRVGTDLTPGERVEVIPNHACTCANLHNQYKVRSRSVGEKAWCLDARGWDAET